VQSGYIREEYVRRMLTAICEGVAFLHARGVRHGALTPPNVVVGGRMPCVLDLTNAYHDDVGSYWKPHLVSEFLAPEQNASSGTPLRPTSDIYAIGQLGYRLLTGDRRALPQACGETWPRQLRDSTIPRRDKHLIARCIQSDPARRPQSMEELLDDLGRSVLAVRVPASTLARWLARALRMIDWFK
jgi:serine/threonine protein kinase